MKKPIVLLMLLMITTLSFSQEAKTFNVKRIYTDMDRIVQFTDTQEKAVMEIFNRCVEERKDLKSEYFPNKKEYGKAKYQIYIDAKKNVYALFTQEQRDAYYADLKQRQDSRKEEIANKRNSRNN